MLQHMIYIFELLCEMVAIESTHTEVLGPKLN